MSTAVQQCSKKDKRRKPNRTSAVQKGSKIELRKKCSFQKKTVDEDEKLEEQQISTIESNLLAAAATPVKGRTSITKALEKDNRSIWATATMSKAAKAIHKEFVSNKKIKPLEYTTEAYESNEPKNRYNDIVCIDATRVVLKDRPNGEDYIHASWMTMPDGRKYISTQAPLTETTEDFWHMVYTEKSQVIVMLCNLVEGKSEKCVRYFPASAEKPETFGAYKVILEEAKKDPFEGIKYQILKVEKEGVPLSIHHFMYHAWVDHVSPLDPGPTVGMLKLAKKNASGGPITVHCSAGIGRTGTFVGIDYASQKIEKNANVNMIEVVRELRAMRFHSIQSAAQYKFLHLCILELFVQEGVITRSGRYAKYLQLYQTGVKRVMSKLANQEG